MSSLASWPSSRVISSLSDDSDIDGIKPDFDQPEYFYKAPGQGAWYCNACSPSHHETHLPSFSATAAMTHEESQAHKDAVAHLASWEPTPTPINWGINLQRWGTTFATWGVEVTDWGGMEDTELEVNPPKWGVDLENWSTTLDPYDQLRDSQLSRVVPLKKRVKRWIRDMARAEGVEFEDDEDLDNDDLTDWTQWGAGGDDWKRPTEEWGLPVGGLPPPVDEDPQASADFKFVEKVAKKRGLKDERRRLHAFYRLPTDEKISRIQEIVQFIHSH